jgi:hypothetical protein
MFATETDSDCKVIETILPDTTKGQTPEEMVEIIRGCMEAPQCFTFMVTYKDGNQEAKRMFWGSNIGKVCEFAPRSRRRGYPVSMDTWKRVDPMRPKEAGKLDAETWVDTAVKRYQKNRAFWFKHADRRLWQNIWKQWEQDKSEQIRAAIMEKIEKGELDIESWKTPTYYHVSHELDIPHFEKNRPNIMDVGKLLCRSDSYIDSLIEAGSGSLSARGAYDYSLSVKRDENDPELLRAWFNAEYKGCGNGHYYLLISPKVAMFCETD